MIQWFLHSFGSRPNLEWRSWWITISYNFTYHLVFSKLALSHPFFTSNNRNLPTKSQESSCLRNYRSRCTSNRQHRWSFLPVADYPHRRLEHQYREVPVLPTLRCAHFVERPVMRRLLNVNYPVVHSWFVKQKHSSFICWMNKNKLTT